jgi:hypothetical protein
MNLLQFILIIFQFATCSILSAVILKETKQPRQFKIKLGSYMGEQFYGNLKIGNFSRKVIFDTGSNFLWVQGRGNHTQMLNCKNNCRELIKNMKINKSVYYIKYGTGSVAITREKGNLEINSGIEEKNMKFNNQNLKLSLIYGESLYEDKSVFEKVKHIKYYFSM